MLLLKDPEVTDDLKIFPFSHNTIAKFGDQTTTEAQINKITNTSVKN